MTLAAELKQEMGTNFSFIVSDQGGIRRAGCTHILNIIQNSSSLDEQKEAIIYLFELCARNLDKNDFHELLKIDSKYVPTNTTFESTTFKTLIQHSYLLLINTHKVLLKELAGLSDAFQWYIEYEVAQQSDSNVQIKLHNLYLKQVENPVATSKEISQTTKETIDYLINGWGESLTNMHRVCLSILTNMISTGVANAEETVLETLNELRKKYESDKNHNHLLSTIINELNRNKEVNANLDAANNSLKASGIQDDGATKIKNILRSFRNAAMNQEYLSLHALEVKLKELTSLEKELKDAKPLTLATVGNAILKFLICVTVIGGPVAMAINRWLPDSFMGINLQRDRYKEKTFIFFKEKYQEGMLDVNEARNIAKKGCD